MNPNDRKLKDEDQYDIDLKGKKQIPKLFKDIPSAFVVKNAMEAVQLAFDEKPVNVWLDESTIKGFSFPKKLNQE